MLPTTRTKLRTAIAKSTLTINSRLTNRSISFLVRVSWTSFHPAHAADCQWFIEFSTQLRSSVARMTRLLGKRKTNSSAIGRPEFLKIAKRTMLPKNSKTNALTYEFSSKYNHSKVFRRRIHMNQNHTVSPELAQLEKGPLKSNITTNKGTSRRNFLGQVGAALTGGAVLVRTPI